MKKYILLLLVLISTSAFVNGQDKKKISKRTLAKEELKKNGVIYDREFEVAGGLHTNGFLLSFRYGVLKKYFLTRFFDFNLLEIKHSKEVRQSLESLGGGFSSPKSFIYGKRNNFYALHIGMGEKRYLSEKAKKRGLAIGVTYSGGFSLGVVKPYYLDLYYPGDGGRDWDIRSEAFSEENANVFLSIDNISGASGIGYGWDEVNIKPGVYAKGSLLFDFGAYDEFVKALEVGVLFDGYLSNVPLMANELNRPFFLNLFVTLHLGKRW